MIEDLKLARKLALLEGGAGLGRNVQHTDNFITFTCLYRNIGFRRLSPKQAAARTKVKIKAISTTKL